MLKSDCEALLSYWIYLSHISSSDGARCKYTRKVSPDPMASMKTCREFQPMSHLFVYHPRGQIIWITLGLVLGECFIAEKLVGSFTGVAFQVLLLKALISICWLGSMSMVTDLMYLEG